MFVNLTPHTINIVTPIGTSFNIPPSGEIARVATTYRVVDEINNISIYECFYGDITGLPDCNGQDYFIVSGLVKTAVPHRTDVFSPGELIRDENGKPVGCRGLRQ